MAEVGYEPYLKITCCRRGDSMQDREPALKLPSTPIGRLMRPLERFLHLEAASGILLVLCTLAALALANSAYREAFAHFWHERFGIVLGSFELIKPIELWINDGLMTLFFFVVGLEIKREIVAGELKEPRKAALPFMAALGGMLAPGGIYYLLERGTPGEPGWGIPMATDIAFVVGILALLGKRVPLGLKIFLLSLAIVDDLGAILVIAIFYTSDLAVHYLVMAACGFAGVLAMRLLGFRRIALYVIVGMFIWYCFLKSGVHPTIAGVVLGLMTPTSAWIERTRFQSALHAANESASNREGPIDRDRAQTLMAVIQESVSPLERLEKSLHAWVAFGIMPIFAFANAGVEVQSALLTHRVSLGVMLGLILGKPIGIVLFSWLAVTLGIAKLPTGVNWKILIGAGCLGGIGFTMSLFIGGLAFAGSGDATLVDAAKIGTLGGSLISAMLGCTLLLMFLPRSGLPRDTAASTLAEDVA
ncbi:MAG: Na+/H+ antiporter NhaA [Gemmataceae bacterium]